jgi:NhaC family Na+:H+ antiporter
MLSRTVEDTGTVTSPLVPWNSCGAYMTGVLGVPTMKYLPYAFFNILNPIIALTFAFVGYRVEHLTKTRSATTGAPPAEQSQGELDVQ